MEISSKISRLITQMMANTLKTLSADEIEKVNYGLMILISNTFKLSIVLLIAAWLGIFKPVLITFLVFGVLRTFAGGIHTRTSWQCLLTTMFFYFSIVYGAIYIPIPFWAQTMLFFVNMILLWLYAPADTIEKPIIGETHQKTLRYWALITMTVLYIISLFQSRIVANIIILASFAECITITPIAYHVTNSKKGQQQIIESEQY